MGLVDGEHECYKLKCDFLYHFDHLHFDNAHANGQRNQNGALTWAETKADWSIGDGLNSETKVLMGLRVWPAKLNENEYEHA